MDVREYDLNLIPGSVPQIIKINQYDKGIQYAFTIYQGDKKFSIPSGSTVLLTGTKPDGLGFTYSCNFSGAVASVTIGDQVAVLSGNVWAELTITSGDSVRLGTANFAFCVEPAALKDDTAVSDSDFPEIIKAVNNIGAAQKSADAAAKSAQDAKNVYQNMSTLSARVDALASDVAVRASLIPTGKQIHSGDDLNNNSYTAVGTYYCSAVVEAHHISNLPEGTAFMMTVYNPLGPLTGPLSGPWQYRLQEFMPFNGAHKYIRMVYTDGDSNVVFGDWMTEY